MSKFSESVPAHEPPAWFDEFASAHTYAHHLVLSGNIRDIFPVWQSEAPAFLDLTGILSQLLRDRGIATSLIYDPVAGLRFAGEPAPALEKSLRQSKVPLESGRLSPDELATVHAEVTGHAETPVALLIDYASHLTAHGEGELDDFFVRIDKQTRAQSDAPGTASVRNPVIWFVDQPADMPDWFVIGNDLLREIQVESPNLEDRFLYARHLNQELGLETGMASGAEAPQETSDRLLQEFALECDGETLVAMNSIARVALSEGISLEHISDAIRVYRTGISRNPWSSGVLANRVRRGREILERRIKGQGPAIEKTLDILARSIVGLSGAQSGARHLKPRGILFLAGPTGVGKTELAKAITELLFGDDTACHRFDMSEFMEEDSVSRLLGAPPGHPGHERGGELVNAAHRRPFSVFLFDEVEKAHPRILDVFLQILDEGRLTDSRGSTAHFSESLIVFTSNIGMTSTSRVQNMGLNVLPSDTHEELESKIERAIQDHFRSDLQRPELLNRIGQNIIIFDFLTGEAAMLIFDSIIARVLDAVKFERGITVEVAPSVIDQIRWRCVENYFEGGRGIGNRIETHFINPLAREIFDNDITEDCRVVDVIFEDRRTRLMLEPADGQKAELEAKPVSRSAGG
ncbi:MAG: AAA family ATPase [Alphaproteobacteria bacterium]|nr:AAA family ATPase [Alphaproteobacteria bacterium]